MIIIVSPAIPMTTSNRGEIATLNTRELRFRVGDNLRINNVRDFNVTSIRLAKENNKPVVTIAYERQVELLLNLDVFAKFNTVLL